MKDDNAVEQMKILDIRLGKGVGATKERAKLQKRIDGGKSSGSSKQTKDPSKGHNLKGKKGKNDEAD